MVLPNFLVVGAIKGGTTSIYNYFKQHPQIYVSPLKEPRYFCYDVNDPSHVSRSSKVFPIRTFEEYLGLFKGVTSERAVGEMSPQYLRSPIAAERIHSILPNARLIISLRNPVGRTYSAYLMACRAGKDMPKVADYFRDSHNLAPSLYYEHVKRFYDIFPSTSIKVILQEDLRRNTLSVVQSLFAFLDVDDSFCPNVDAVYNAGGVPKNKALCRIFQVSNKRLKMTLKPRLPSWLLNARLRLKNFNFEQAPPLSGEIRRRSHNFFSDDISRLETLINLDLSAWRNENVG